MGSFVSDALHPPGESTLICFEGVLRSPTIPLSDGERQLSASPPITFLATGTSHPSRRTAPKSSSRVKPKGRSHTDLVGYIKHVCGGEWPESFSPRAWQEDAGKGTPPFQTGHGAATRPHQ